MRGVVSFYAARSCSVCKLTIEARSAELVSLQTELRERAREMHGVSEGACVKSSALARNAIASGVSGAFCGLREVLRW